MALVQRRFLPKECQMLLFSATYDDEVMKFAESIIPEPIVIRLRREEESLDNIRQFYVKCTGMEQKFEALSNMYGVISIGQCIVFCHVSAFFVSNRGNTISKSIKPPFAKKQACVSVDHWGTYSYLQTFLFNSQLYFLHLVDVNTI